MAQHTVDPSDVIDALNNNINFEAELRTWGNEDSIATDDDVGAWELGMLKEAGYTLCMTSSGSLVFNR